MTEQNTRLPAIEQPPSRALVPAQAFDLSPKTLDEALRFADMLSKSNIVPKDFIGNPGNILVAVQWGMEIGLKPMQSMQNIAVINGRPSLWGDAVLALVMASPVCESVKEEFIDGIAYCRAKRRGSDEVVRSFSMEDAQKAGLASKAGPWTQYPKRMQQMRARSFALRDAFPDVLKGMPIAEEVMDYQGELDRANPPQPAFKQSNKPPLTDAQAELVADLEAMAREHGLKVFEPFWKGMDKEDRNAIGLAERNRLIDVAKKSDEDFNAYETARLTKEKAASA